MAGTPSNAGVAPRTIEEIYRAMDAGRHAHEHSVKASVMELYCNEVNDLLARPAKPAVPPDSGQGGRRSTAASPRASPRATPRASSVSIRQDRDGDVILDNLTEHECHDQQELQNVLERGNQQRSIASTSMNTESSRSHLVLIIKILCRNRLTSQSHQGKIIICDLAGSERLKKSESTGERQREAIEINKSLTALGDVIEALTKGHRVIPYRNHKLTQILQDSLGGSAKVLMFVNCSPASGNYEETLISLKYAARAKNIINTYNKPDRGRSSTRSTQLAAPRSSTPPAGTARSATPARSAPPRHSAR